jgi:hypothetical protein
MHDSATVLSRERNSACSVSQQCIDPRHHGNAHGDLAFGGGFPSRERAKHKIFKKKFLS